MAALSGPDCVSPYYDAHLLERQWKELDSLFTKGTQGFSLGGTGSDAVILLLCYDGDTSRLASSILRSKGVKAFSLKGGASGVSGSLEKLRDSGGAGIVPSGEQELSNGAEKQ